MLVGTVCHAKKTNTLVYVQSCTNLLTMYVHTCTMLYMEYKLADFRKKTKEAFDWAMRGHDVFIIRNSMKFRLYLEEVTFSEKNGLPVLKVRDKSTTEERAKEILAEPKVKSLTDIPGVIRASELRYCPNGHAIPEGRSKCLGKGCKYS